MPTGDIIHPAWADVQRATARVALSRFKADPVLQHWIVSTTDPQTTDFLAALELGDAPLVRAAQPAALTLVVLGLADPATQGVWRRGDLIRGTAAHPLRCGQPIADQTPSVPIGMTKTPSARR